MKRRACVDQIRQLLALLTGLLWGAIPLTGLYAFIACVPAPLHALKPQSFMMRRGCQFKAPNCNVLPAQGSGSQRRPSPVLDYVATVRPASCCPLACCVPAIINAAHVWCNMRRLDLEEFGGSTIVNNEGFAPAVATFMLAWIGTYTMLHS